MTSDSARVTNTALGILAILIWSTSFAFGRSVMEQLGTFGGAACIYLLGGSLGCLLMIFQRRLGGFLRMPPAYLLVCGGLFITYIVTIQTGLGFARDRQQAVEVILLNYLWPGLTMALSVPLQGRRARWWLIPGVLLGLAGAALGVASGRGISGWQMLENLRVAPMPYLLGTAAAVSWALYSNLSRRLAGQGQSQRRAGVPAGQRPGDGPDVPVLDGADALGPAGAMGTDVLSAVSGNYWRTRSGRSRCVAARWDSSWPFPI